MSLIITAQDVYNTLNIDLAAKLQCKNAANETTVVEHFLDKAQGYLFDFINLYRYRYVDYENIDDCLAPHARKVLERAMLYQVEYMLKNRDSSNLGGIVMTSSGVQTIDRNLRMIDRIAPNAEQLLLTSGLCYSGRRG